MKLIKLFSFFIYLFFYSCTNHVFKSEIPAWLNIDDIEILDSNTFDEFGGFGEGVTLEVYSLSTKSIRDFENNENKNLPERNGWSKINWVNADKFSMQEEIDFIFDYQGENNNIKGKTQHMKFILSDSNSYVALYYNGNDIKKTNKFILLILNTIENRLYIYEFLM